MKADTLRRLRNVLSVLGAITVVGWIAWRDAPGYLIGLSLLPIWGAQAAHYAYRRQVPAAPPPPRHPGTRL